MKLSIPVRDIEIAIAAEAASHAAAAAELNPFGEAEFLELGDARAVYCGQWSPVHGVFGLGLDGPVEERDFREVDKFFQKKERSPAYWINQSTDPSLLQFLECDYKPTKKISVHGFLFAEKKFPLPDAMGNSNPDHSEWANAFTRLLDPTAQEAGLIALTKLHQKETRFYIGPQNAASYTYFQHGIALVPYASTHSLLALQIQEAQNFRAKLIAVMGPACPLPLLFERTLYELL